MIEKVNPLKTAKIQNVYHITEEENLPLIIKNGLLSRNMVIKYKMKFNDISDKEIQEKREEKKIHDYASTYLNPKNAMLYRIIKENRNVAIVEFGTDFVFEKRAEDILVSNKNAAASNAVIENLANVNIEKFLDMKKVFAQYWTDHGETLCDIKQSMQSEILVKNIIEPRWIKRIILKDYKQRTRIINLLNSYGLNFKIQIDIDEDKEFYFLVDPM